MLDLGNLVPMQEQDVVGTEGREFFKYCKKSVETKARNWQWKNLLKKEECERRRISVKVSPLQLTGTLAKSAFL